MMCAQIHPYKLNVRTWRATFQLLFDQHEEQVKHSNLRIFILHVHIFQRGPAQKTLPIFHQIQIERLDFSIC